MMFTFSPHIALQVHDHEAACDFYERVLGMQRVESVDGFCHDKEVAFRKDAVMFYVEEGISGSTFFEFRVEDMARAEAVLLDAGCVVTHEYNAKSKMIADPYGLRFHIWQAMASSGIPATVVAAPHKDHLLRCLETEIGSCRHLGTLIPDGSLSFRPHETMRSMEELLQYLTWIGIATVAHCLNNVPDGATDAYTYYAERNESIPPEMFPAAMDAQMKEIRTAMAEITDEDLITRKVNYPWGVEAPLGEAIVEIAIKWLASYKMQLLLYIRMVGDSKTVATDWAVMP